jgi:hypothetical protein
MTAYFQFEDKFYQQNEGMAMENSLSPVASNIYMEHFEEIALSKAITNPLNGTGKSVTLPWFGHMNQQDYSNFFAISTLDLPSNLQWKLKLLLLLRSWTFW